MKQFKLYGFLVVLSLLLAACGSSTPTVKPANTPANFDPNEFLTLLNQFRSQPQTCTENGVTTQMPAVPPVVLNDQLNASAKGHAQDMATKKYFSHDSQDGNSFYERNTAAGYGGQSIGENIARGRETAQDTLDQWRNSKSGHCNLMMNANTNEIGIGYGFRIENFGPDLDIVFSYWVFLAGRKNQ